MQSIQQLFGGAILMFANVVILLYICQRFLAATRLRRKIMTEMREFTRIVRRARNNVRYIGEQVAKGMDEIKEDVGKELRVTDRLTNQSAKLAAILQRFTALEENVIELVRTDRNRESVRIETPIDVSEEIKRILATAAERKRVEEGEWEEEGVEGVAEWRKTKESKPTGGIGIGIGIGSGSGSGSGTGRAEVGSIGAGYPNRAAAPRNPLSKFSACGFSARRTTDGRPRISTMPEVRLLGERPKEQPRNDGQI